MKEISEVDWGRSNENAIVLARNDVQSIKRTDGCGPGDSETDRTTPGSFLVRIFESAGNSAGYYSTTGSADAVMVPSTSSVPRQVLRRLKEQEKDDIRSLVDGAHTVPGG